MRRIAALTAVLALGFLLFYAYARTPAPLSANAPADVFSAGRAMADIAAMAPVPHPEGSAANARVRDYLVARMTRLGLSPRIQRDRTWRAETSRGETWVSGGDVENVIGVLKGSDPTLPALALMAHYDSVAGSPGAADDITGVAGILEVTRALEARGRPRRDVMLVITDGEEAGLLGANAFFADDPAARHVGFVLNLEARGGGGRAAMFETGPGNGAAARLFLRTAARPSASSLAVFVYKLLPNDTDYTVAKAAGVAGLNFAFIGRQFDYHSPSSTVAALDHGSAQQIGDEVLGPARALAFADTLPPRADDAVYSNIVGGLVAIYPPWAGWIVLAVAAALVLAAAVHARRTGALTWWDLAQGFAAALLLLAAAALGLHLVRHATGIGFGWYEGRALLARFTPFEVAMAFAALAAGLLTAAGMALGRVNGRAALLALVVGAAASAFGGFDPAALIEGAATAILAFLVLSRRANLTGTWIGLLLSGLLAAALLQAFSPTIAFVVAWPTLAGAACALLFAPGGKTTLLFRTAALIVMVVVIAWVASLFHTLLQAMDMPEGPAIVIWLASLSLWPLLWPSRSPRWAIVVSAAAPFAMGVALALWLHFTSPWSPRHPAAAEPLYVVDYASGRAWRANPFRPGPWAAAVLRADGGTVARRTFPGFIDDIWAASAKSVATEPPPIAVSRGADGVVVVHAGLAPQAQLRLDLMCDAVVTSAEIDGKPAPIVVRPGRWSHLIWQAAPEGFTLAFRPLGHGALHLRYAQWTPSWPAAATPLPPMPANVMAWDRSGATVVTGALRQTW